MLRIFLLALLICLLSFPSFAQTKTEEDKLICSFLNDIDGSKAYVLKIMSPDGYTAICFEEYLIEKGLYRKNDSIEQFSSDRAIPQNCSGSKIFLVDRSLFDSLVVVSDSDITYESLKAAFPDSSYEKYKPKLAPSFRCFEICRPVFYRDYAAFCVHTSYQRGYYLLYKKQNGDWCKYGYLYDAR